MTKNEGWSPGGNPARALQAGGEVIIRPGARIPADGIVHQGQSSIDESHITGESLPVSKTPGFPVYEATVNLVGVLEVKITKAIAESTVARMIALVTKSQEAKAPSERFSDWFGQRYTLAVPGGAVLALAGFYWATDDWDKAVYRAATLLVAASPCAIVLSVPSAILSALSASARIGVLFKGGAALETLAAIDQFAFDKTGTLTTGKAAVTEIVTLEGGQEDFLSLLAGLESHSEHHSAEAIRREDRQRNIEFAQVAEVVNRPGAGIVGSLNGQRIWAGNPHLASQMKASTDHSALKELAGKSETIIYLGRNDQVLGAVSLADKLRPTSISGLQALKENGIQNLLLMTGDRKPVAMRIGLELGLPPENIHAEMLPEDKVRLVGQFAQKGKFAFVEGTG